MNPLITVYITNYNYGNFVQEAIESVLNQTIKDFELIIIDDGSTDHSKNVIEQYASHPSISIIYQKNKGLNVTNNIAMRAAKGKYIMRLDADDYLEKDALLIMSKKLESDQQLGLIFPNYYYVDAEGNLIGEEKRHDFDKDVQLMDQPAHGACTMIRLEFLKEVGGYNEAYNCQDGYELWVKFIRHHKISNIEKPLFYYRQHGSNLTGDEHRILDTRASINANFIAERSFDTRTLAIIPVRGGDQDLAYRSLSGTNILEQKINKTIQAKNIERIIVTSPDDKISTLLKESSLEGEVTFHKRDQAAARFNQSLNPTVDAIVSSALEEDLSFEAIVLLTLEYPFLKPNKIDDIINTMFIFGSDSIIGVRSDNSVFYQHHGDGLHAIMNRDKYTKLEREALFKQVGGISAVTKSHFLKSRQMMSGKVGHVMMDQHSSLGLFSKVDWDIAEFLISKYSSSLGW